MVHGLQPGGLPTIHICFLLFLTQQFLAVYVGLFWTRINLTTYALQHPFDLVPSCGVGLFPLPVLHVYSAAEAPTYRRRLASPLCRSYKPFVSVASGLLGTPART